MQHPVFMEMGDTCDNTPQNVAEQVFVPTKHHLKSKWRHGPKELVQSLWIMEKISEFEFVIKKNDRGHVAMRTVLQLLDIIHELIPILLFSCCQLLANGINSLSLGAACKRSIPNISVPTIVHTQRQKLQVRAWLRCMICAIDIHWCRP